jgi:hypothetical protein
MIELSDIARARLRSQRLTHPMAGEPVDVVAWLGAVQAQDYGATRWNVGMRLRSATDASVEKAFNDGAILRTHVLRPTWHFVTPADIRWMLALTAPRVHALSASRYRHFGLDQTVFKRCDAVLTKALRGGKHLTREELHAVFEKAGIATRGESLMSHLLMRAELDQVICSGPRKGKQFTYALLEERAPSVQTMHRADALAALARRFFQSRGPATVQDFAKWSGLTVADATRGLSAVESELEHEAIGRRTLWFPPARRTRGTDVPTAHLLGIYDEYISGYKDRSEIVDPKHRDRLVAMGAAVTRIVVVNGRVIGTWSRTVGRRDTRVTWDLFVRVSPAERQAIAAARDRYLAFMGTPMA